MTQMPRYLVSVTPEQAAYVNAQRKETGASAAEIIRRLLDKALAMKAAK